MCSMLPLWKQIDVLCDALSDNICEISDSDLLFHQNPTAYSMQTPTQQESMIETMYNKLSAENKLRAMHLLHDLSQTETQKALPATPTVMPTTTPLAVASLQPENISPAAFGVGAGMGAGIGAGMGAGMGAAMGAAMGAGMGAAMGAGMGAGTGAGMEAGMGAGMGAAMGAGTGAGMGAGMNASGASVVQTNEAESLSGNALFRQQPYTSSYVPSRQGIDESLSGNEMDVSETSHDIDADRLSKHYFRKEEDEILIYEFNKRKRSPVPSERSNYDFWGRVQRQYSCFARVTLYSLRSRYNRLVKMGVAKRKH